MGALAAALTAACGITESNSAGPPVSGSESGAGAEPEIKAGAGSGGTSGRGGTATSASSGAGGSGGQVEQAPRCPGGGPAGSAQVVPWLATEPVPASGCTASPSAPPNPNFGVWDECGCDDRECSPSEACLQVHEITPGGAVGPSSPRNVCLALCASDGDCAAPSVCVGERHGLKVCAPACRSDQDCGAELCGVCVEGAAQGHVVPIADPSGNYCAYPSACGAESCAACQPTEQGWHRCGN